MNVLDLYCGLGGFSQAFRDRGHRVVGVDIVPPADILADVRRLPLSGVRFHPDIILAAPPCTEFSREDQPWHRSGKVPDMSLVHAVYKAVDFFRPLFWVMENVRGAKKWFPESVSLKVGSRYFWGRFPLFLVPKGYKPDKGKWRLPPSPDRARIRSKVEYEISLRLCEAVELSLAARAEVVA